MNKIFIICVLTMFSLMVQAKEYGKVVMMKGKATILYPGEREAKELKENDKIPQDSSILTYDKSFVKIIFPDGSTLNLGSKSKMVVQQFKTKDDPSITVLMKGVIRAKVQKDYNLLRKNKEVFLIRTVSASLGVRGTEFQISTSDNHEFASVVTFEGSVAVTPTITNIKQEDKKEFIVDAGKAFVVAKAEELKVVKVKEESLKSLKEDEEMNKVKDIVDENNNIKTLVVETQEIAQNKINFGKTKVGIEYNDILLESKGSKKEYKAKGFTLNFYKNIQDQTNDLDLYAGLRYVSNPRNNHFHLVENNLKHKTLINAGVNRVYFKNNYITYRMGLNFKENYVIENNSNKDSSSSEYMMNIRLIDLSLKISQIGVLRIYNDLSMDYNLRMQNAMEFQTQVLNQKLYFKYNYNKFETLNEETISGGILVDF